MSQSQSINRPSEPVGNLETENRHGQPVSVKISGRPARPSRVDVEIDGGRRWVFAVNDTIATLVLLLNENGQRIDPVLPPWVEPLVRQVGLEGVEE